MNKITPKEFIYITLAMGIISSAVYFFMIPSQIVVGSMSGIAMIINQLAPIPISTITFILNTILLIVGFLFIGKEFGAKTVYTSFLLPIFLAIFETFIPITGSLTQNNVYDLAAYILLTAFGQAMLFNVNASSGGIDILGKIVSKYTHMEIGKAMTLCGMLTALMSILVYDVGTLIVSVLGTYANGVAIDYFIEGFNKKKKICILSENYPEIQDYILNTIHRGVTIYEAKGGFENNRHTELVTIMTTSEYKKLLDYLHQSDFKVFVTISTVNEVIGSWGLPKKKVG